MRMIEGNKLQVVLFIRYCKVPPEIRDLNYGSSELAGIVASSSELTDTEDDIMAYVNYTNRASDYDILKSISGGRRKKQTRRKLVRRYTRHK